MIDEIMGKKIKRVGLFVCCFLVSFIYLFPQIQLKQPNLLDVTETWGFGKDVIHNTLTEFSNPERFRPLYASERSFFNLLFNYHASYYFLAFALILTFTLYCMISLLNNRLNIWHYVLLGILLFISPVTLDTYWRLGTAENLFSLILVLCVFLLLNNKYFFAVCSLVCLMLAKETAIVYIPVFLIYLLMKRRYTESAFLFIGYSLFFIKVYFLGYHAITHPGIYTSLFSPALPSVGEMIAYYVSANLFYFILFGIGVVCFIFRVRRECIENCTHSLYNGLLFISLVIVGVIAVAMFHNKNQPYYFFPTLVLIIVFFLWEGMATPRIIQIGIVTSVLLLFFITNIPLQAIDRAQFWQGEYIGDGALITEILNHVDTRTYHFILYGRPEYKPALQFIYSTFRKRKTQFHLYTIDNGSYNPVAPNSGVLCGRSFIGVSYCTWRVAPQIE